MERILESMVGGSQSLIKKHYLHGRRAWTGLGRDYVGCFLFINKKEEKEHWILNLDTSGFRTQRLVALGLVTSCLKPQFPHL